VNPQSYNLRFLYSKIIYIWAIDDDIVTRSAKYGVIAPISGDEISTITAVEEIETFTAEDSVVAVVTIDYIVKACTAQIDPAAIGCHVRFLMGLGFLIELARPMVNNIMVDRTNCDRQD
jgi:hypothetical protein